ncbi:MAG: peptidylprolyl isomerase [Bacilli bacterium]|nr:peptidylprolyl isomerase [Bacilli bacterium]
MVKIFVKDYGVMSFEMDYDAAPISAANFVDLARKGFYDGLTFHRIIKGFMIQGGDGRSKGRFLDYTIKGEFKSNGVNNPLLHERGVLSMARTMIRDSATSQFFVMHKKSPWLDGEYAAFGRMIEGEDVLDAIAGVKTNGNDAPLKPVIIDHVEVIDEPEKSFPVIR